MKFMTLIFISTRGSLNVICYNSMITVEIVLTKSKKRTSAPFYRRLKELPTRTSPMTPDTKVIRDFDSMVIILPIIYSIQVA